MDLREAIGLAVDAEFDASLPTAIRGIPVGNEAALEIEKLLVQPTVKNISLINNIEGTKDYFFVSHHLGLSAEICRLTPYDNGVVWPTAAEVALVHCAQLVSADTFSRIVEGKSGFCLYDAELPDPALRIALELRTAEDGPNDLVEKYSSAHIRIDFNDKIIDKVCRSLSQSFDAKPMKYRFIEVYRILENLYLRSAYDRFSDRFFSDPESAVHTLSESIRSERNQLYSLAEPVQDLFEDIYKVCNHLRTNDNNKFIWAVFRSIERKYKDAMSPQWKVGASFIYAIRCAIVHAGEKDVVFDNFSDGNDALTLIIAPFEVAALRLVGVEMQA